jgi:hypothetical protein
MMHLATLGARRTFELGHGTLDVGGRRSLGLYFAERSIIDVVRMRHREGRLAMTERPSKAVSLTSEIVPGAPHL